MLPLPGSFYLDSWTQFIVTVRTSLRESTGWQPTFSYFTFCASFFVSHTRSFASIFSTKIEIIKPLSYSVCALCINDTVYLKINIRQWKLHHIFSDMLCLCSWFSESSCVLSLSFIFMIIRCLHRDLLLQYLCLT